MGEINFPVRLVWQPDDRPDAQELTAILSATQLSALWSAVQLSRARGLDSVAWIPILQDTGSVKKMLFRLCRIESMEKVK